MKSPPLILPLLLLLAGKVIAVPAPVPPAHVPSPSSALPFARAPGVDALPQPDAANRGTPQDSLELRAVAVAFAKALNKQDWDTVLRLFSPEVRQAAEQAESYEAFFAPILPADPMACQVRIYVIGAVKQSLETGVVYLEIQHAECDATERILWTWFLERGPQGWFIASFSNPVAASNHQQGFWMQGINRN